MIGLFNDCFPPIMDGVSLTTQNYAYWLHRKAGNVCVVTPKSPDARDAEEYPVYRYSSVPIPMRKLIDWVFRASIGLFTSVSAGFHSSWYMPIVPFLREHWPCRLPENSMFRL